MRLAARRGNRCKRRSLRILDFSRGPRTLSKRGTATDDRQAFVVEKPSGRYLSARWPGDAFPLAKRLVQRLGLQTLQNRRKKLGRSGWPKA